MILFIVSADESYTYNFKIDAHLLIDPNIKLDEKQEIPVKYIFDSEITKHNFKVWMFDKGYDLKGL